MLISIMFMLLGFLIGSVDMILESKEEYRNYIL